MVRDFCFWAVWAAGPVHKKKYGTDYEQLLRAVFSCFLKNTIAYALKNCIIFKKKNNFGIKLSFFRAAHILKFAGLGV